MTGQWLAAAFVKLHLHALVYNMMHLEVLHVRLVQLVCEHRLDALILLLNVTSGHVTVEKLGSHGHLLQLISIGKLMAHSHIHNSVRELLLNVQVFHQPTLL